MLTLKNDIKLQCNLFYTLQFIGFKFLDTNIHPSLTCLNGGRLKILFLQLC